MSACKATARVATTMTIIGLFVVAGLAPASAQSFIHTLTYVLHCNILPLLLTAARAVTTLLRKKQRVHNEILRHSLRMAVGTQDDSGFKSFSLVEKVLLLGKLALSATQPPPPP